MTPPPQDIAVVGAGLAGLAAAWWLGRVHRVTLYERQPRPGFTASSVGLPGGVRVDVPLRVFYPGYYPTLTRLYARLGIASEPVSYAATFTDAAGRAYFRYRNLQAGQRAWGYVLPQDLWRDARARAIVRGLLRFRREAMAGDARVDGRSLGELVRGYPADFVEGFLLPAVCTVCTCSAEAARAFPAATIVDYARRGLVREAVRRVQLGADEVERVLRQGIPALHCGAPVRALQRSADGVLLRLEDGRAVAHDHVVIAAAAPQALAMLADAGPEERRVLGAFRTQPVTVLTHTDPALMPARRADWSPVHLRVADGAAAPESTIWVNAVQPALRGAADVFQTVHPQRAPAPGRLLGEARFERTVVDAASLAALAGLAALHAQPARRVWFCGAWAQAGIPLLESAVRSAQVVAQCLGIDEEAKEKMP